MKVVQTEVSDLEYALLIQIASEKNSTIKSTVKEAIKTYVKMEKVDPDDSFFSEPVAKKGPKNGSIKHDAYLYR
ncbi:MAG: hypothetical protein V3R86_02025 [Candidatus Hydrothermarchaeaceae archaeon]